MRYSIDNKIKEIENTVDRENLVYRASEYTYSFKNFQAIRTFDKDIYNAEITLQEADDVQGNLLIEIMNFKKKRKHKIQRKNKKKKDILKKLYAFFEGRERVLDAFKSRLFPGSGFSNFAHSRLEILSPKQMLQRLKIALAQVKAGNNSESLLNEIRQIVYSLYQSK